MEPTIIAIYIDFDMAFQFYKKKQIKISLKYKI